MVIIFKGNDALALEQRLQEFSGKDQRTTLTFMLENFEIPSERPCTEEELKNVYKNA